MCRLKPCQRAAVRRAVGMRRGARTRLLPGCCRDRGGPAPGAVRSGRCRAHARLYLDRWRLVLGGRATRLASRPLGSPATRLPLGASHLAPTGWPLAHAGRSLGARGTQGAGASLIARIATDGELPTLPVDVRHGIEVLVAT